MWTEKHTEWNLYVCTNTDSYINMTCHTTLSSKVIWSRTLLSWPAGHDWDVLWWHISEHISSLLVSIFPNLADAHPCMSKLVTDRIEIPTGPESSTQLYLQNTCPESSRILASPLSHHKIWRISQAWSTSSWGWWQYHCCAETVWSC